MTAAPLVDIALVTYNHEKFIAQAIESVLIQKTNFPYRLIIGDDCSTDDTQAIIKIYEKKYPDQIETILLSEHLGLFHENRVGIQVLKHCTAKYVAMLDGDDYWTDPHKLQKQVDLLETHPECAICGHNVEMKYGEDDTPTGKFCPPDQKEFAFLDDLLLGYPLPTLSVMFRNGLIEEFPDWFFSLPFGDTAILILNLLGMKNGKIGYLNEVMGVYRVHQNGIWSGRTAIAREVANIEEYQTFVKILPEQYYKNVQARLNRHCYRLGSILADEVTDTKLPTVEQVIDQCGIEQKMQGLKLGIQEQRHIRGGFYKKLVFGSGQFGKAIRLNMIVRAVINDKRLLFYKGLWRVGLEILLGTHFANRLRFRGARAR